MKAFLFDENVPSCLSIVPSKPLLSARDAVRARASDREIWDFAKQNECAIVSKDADFSDLILASQPPPWVVHLRFGNLRRRDYHRLLAQVTTTQITEITVFEVRNVRLQAIFLPVFCL